MSANNIVQGPWGNLPPSPDDKSVAEKVQSDFLFIMSQILNNMEFICGVTTLDDESYVKDLALIAESIRSYLYKGEGKYHPCQDIADHFFSRTSTGLQLNDSIMVEFK